LTARFFRKGSSPEGSSTFPVNVTSPDIGWGRWFRTRIPSEEQLSHSISQFDLVMSPMAS